MIAFAWLGSPGESNTGVRSGALLETAYGEIAASIRAAPRVCTDETGSCSSGTRTSL
ncbi:MAG: hypothetical protein HYV63_06605 [Candidatus Schekmanbacteria bacterium]|nr:hypothetical protein [Candidatus Schekmanbacteria bacterium]